VLTDDLLGRVYAVRGIRKQIGDAHLLVPWEQLAAQEV
jgi:hypothetical protein